MRVRLEALRNPLPSYLTAEIDDAHDDDQQLCRAEVGGDGVRREHQEPPERSFSLALGGGDVAGAVDARQRQRQAAAATQLAPQLLRQRAPRSGARRRW